VGWGNGVRASPGEGEKPQVEQEREEPAPHELEEGVEPVEQDELARERPGEQTACAIWLIVLKTFNSGNASQLICKTG